MRVPADLVRARAEQTSVTREKWIEARATKDFAVVAKELRALLHLSVEFAQVVRRPGASLYEALFDQFEPDGKVAEVGALFADLRPRLTSLLQQAVEKGRSRPIVDFPRGGYAKDRQLALFTKLVSLMGFDLSGGRIDGTVHPFCETVGPRDVRLTTRFDEDSFLGGMFAVVHEAGHGIYDQGLQKQFDGLPLGKACSLSIHESQSLIWENHVASAKPFWDLHYSLLDQAFPGRLSQFSADDFYRHVNRVQPSLIRVEADEVSYSLHVIIRFELERALVEGDLAVNDLPAAWNDAYRDYLGITPPSDLEGVLQDTHWYIGAFGYFPTYSLGAIYAAELFQHFVSTQPTGYAALSKGDYAPFREWLQRSVHQHGQRYPSQELMAQVLGRAAGVDSFLKYLRVKYLDD